MKALRCELCSSNEFTKIDGLFQCNRCRTKYTQDEAKKLFVEGTVTLDRTDEAHHLLVISQTAYDSNNLAEAYAYANRVLELQVNNAEAWFLKGACAARGATLDTVEKALGEAHSSFRTGAAYCREDARGHYQARCGVFLAQTAERLYGESFDFVRRGLYAGTGWNEHILRCGWAAPVVRSAQYASRFFRTCGCRIERTRPG